MVPTNLSRAYGYLRVLALVVQQGRGDRDDRGHRQFAGRLA
jgi:hypothetical protein